MFARLSTSPGHGPGRDPPSNLPAEPSLDLTLRRARAWGSVVDPVQARHRLTQGNTYFGRDALRRTLAMLDFVWPKDDGVSMRLGLDRPLRD